MCDTPLNTFSPLFDPIKKKTTLYATFSHFVTLCDPRCKKSIFLNGKMPPNAEITPAIATISLKKAPEGKVKALLFQRTKRRT